MADYVTLREYDTVAEAKDAEQQLVLGGISAVNRTGKKLKVDVMYESQARALLAGSTTPADTVANAASTASDTAQSAVSTVGDAAQSAASTVVDAATSVASSAAETVQDAASTVTEQTSKVTSVAADKVRDLADTVRQQGSSPDAPRVQQQAAQTTAGVLEKTSQYIAPGGVQTLLSDVRSSIQRHPLRSLLIGLSVGYLLRSRFFPAQAAAPSSTAPAAPSRPTPPSPTPALGYPAESTQPALDVPAPTSTALGSAPLLDTPADTSLAIDDLDTTGVLVGDDVIDADIAMTDVDTDLGSSLDASVGTTGVMDTDLDVGTADVNVSTGAADLYADVVDTDLSMGTLDTDTLMDESVTGVDTIGSTSMDADFSSTGTIGDIGTSDTFDTSADTFLDTPSTTPLSTDDLNTGTRDASFGGETSDLGDALTQWDERTRNEGSGA